MEEKIFRLLSGLALELQKTDYMIDLSEEKMGLEVLSVEAKFLKKDSKTPLLIFNAKVKNGHTESSIVKNENVEMVYENYLANISPVTRESDWWTTLSEFINIVNYAIKMKKGMKEIVSLNIS